MERLKIGVYGPNNSPLVGAAIEGLLTLGHRPEHLYHATFAAGNTAGESRAVVTCGDRGKLAEVAQHYGAAGTPVILIGEPLLPEEGRRLVTRADLPGWLPPAEAEDGQVGAARLKTLGISVAVKKRVKAQAILLIGQPASPTVNSITLAAWFDDTVATLRRISDSRITYLPAAEDDSRGAEEVDEILARGTPAAEAFDRSWLAVTYSSPLGLDALIAGMPVVDSGASVYSPLCGSLQRFATIKPPARKAVEALLHAILAAQWTSDEIATGAPFVAPLAGDRFELGAVAAGEEAEEGVADPADPAPADTQETPPAQSTETPAKAAKGAKK